MLGLIIRIFVAAMILAGVFFLFAFSIVAAAIITPIVLLILYFVGRKNGIRVWTVRTGPGSSHRRPGQGPVIDHDPNDLPDDPPNDERKGP